jgi:hypothetical protein
MSQELFFMATAAADSGVNLSPKATARGDRDFSAKHLPGHVPPVFPVVSVPWTRRLEGRPTAEADPNRTPRKTTHRAL